MKYKQPVCIDVIEHADIELITTLPTVSCNFSMEHTINPSAYFASIPITQNNTNWVLVQSLLGEFALENYGETYDHFAVRITQFLGSFNYGIARAEAITGTGFLDQNAFYQQYRESTRLAEAGCDMSEYITPLLGVGTFLHGINQAGYEKYIISNSDKATIEQGFGILRKDYTGFFATVISAEINGHMKPELYVFEEFVQTQGIQRGPEGFYPALYISNRVEDITAAREANWTTTTLVNRYGKNYTTDDANLNLSHIRVSSFPSLQSLWNPATSKGTTG